MNFVKVFSWKWINCIYARKNVVLTLSFKHIAYPYTDMHELKYLLYICDMLHLVFMRRGRVGVANIEMTFDILLSII